MIVFRNLYHNYMLDVFPNQIKLEQIHSKTIAKYEIFFTLKIYLCMSIKNEM